MEKTLIILLILQLAATALGKCLSNSDCSASQLCKKRRCVDLDQCADNSDCRGRLACIKQHCTKPSKCSDNSDCGRDNRGALFCMDEICARPGECHVDSDCWGDYFPDGSSSRHLLCKNEQCVHFERAQCVDSNDCNGRMMCQNQRCVFPEEMVCFDNTDCSGRLVCKNDRCEEPVSAECVYNSDCSGFLVCKYQHCVDPCIGVCGDGAQCQLKNNLPTCSCPSGFSGNPRIKCRPLVSGAVGNGGKDELCHPNPCGANTKCEVVNDVPTCKCLPGYRGSPTRGCKHGCESNAECGPQMACIEFKCQNPCSQCGVNAECDSVRNHVPLCKCPTGYYGNSMISCQRGCVQDGDCPPGKPACYANVCWNPCYGVCGVNATCELSDDDPVCLCPKGMTGDPSVMCRPLEECVNGNHCPDQHLNGTQKPETLEGPTWKIRDV